MTVGDVERELNYVGKLLCDTAVRTLPLSLHSKKTRWRNSALIVCSVCTEQKACKSWKDAGSPTEGPLYDEKCHLCRAVRKRVRFCAAQAETRRIHRSDRMFAAKVKGRFRLPQ